MENTVHMLEQGKVRAVNQFFLQFLAPIETNFLSILQKTGMAKSVLALKLLLRCRILAKWWRQNLDQHSCKSDHCCRHNQHFHTNGLT